MDKLEGIKEMREWLENGIKYFKEDSELGKNAKEQRSIAYKNAINKIDMIIRDKIKRK